MTIPALPLNPPRTGVSSYDAIRKYMFQPYALEGKTQGERLRRFWYAFADTDGNVVARWDGDLHIQFFNQNDVSHWRPCNLYFCILDGEDKLLWSIPATTAAFLYEVWKTDKCK